MASHFSFLVTLNVDSSHKMTNESDSDSEIEFMGTSKSQLNSNNKRPVQRKSMTISKKSSVTVSTSNSNSNPNPIPPSVRSIAPLPSASASGSVLKLDRAQMEKERLERLERFKNNSSSNNLPVLTSSHVSKRQKSAINTMSKIINESDEERERGRERERERKLPPPRVGVATGDLLNPRGSTQTKSAWETKGNSLSSLSGKPKEKEAGGSKLFGSGNGNASGGSSLIGSGNAKSSNGRIDPIPQAIYPMGGTGTNGTPLQATSRIESDQRFEKGMIKVSSLRSLDDLSQVNLVCSKI